MGLGYWLLSMFLVFFLFNADMAHRGNQQTLQMAESENKQRARQTVLYINTLNDYLYDHPQSDGVINDSVLGFTPFPSLSHVIQAGRVFVYQPNNSGLMSALKTMTRGSALLGRVQHRRLIDTLGADMQVSVPDVIPETYLVYLN
jgi:hypothetical protein